ncbi:hypothetical protein L9W97_15810 [Vibrio aestuarianus]|uniref:hypothetical protein n=1 Tax=Vibrio aestuarianus TaxID=28171 RepID=UPI00237D055F|nr:hypothetical protein [Vibrio aestuarianus]MDE1326603.1 hypothetical protein [Vibrio aestuarianus]
MNRYSTIVFYFPYREVGGVSVLFLRLAQMLSKSYEVILMDFNDGYMARNLPKNVKFVEFDKPELLPENSILVVQSIPLWRIPHIESFPLDISIFYWNLHPDNLYPGMMPENPARKNYRWIAPLVNSLSLIRKKKIQKMLLSLERNKAIAFMDLENKSKTYGFFHKNQDDSLYLPIMTGYENLQYRCDGPVDEVKCLWIGRLESFKIPILMHTINRLSECSQNVTLTIIGDGMSAEIVKDFASQYKNFCCNFVGTIPFQVLDDYISSYHIVFSMGTSALEGAKNRIPTFCLDYSYQKINGLYRYKYIFEANEYNVGEEITTDHLEVKSTISEKIDDIVNNYSYYSNECYEYWKKNHSPETISIRFIEYIESSTCKLHDLISLGVSREDILTKLVLKLHHPIDKLSGFVSR